MLKPLKRVLHHLRVRPRLTLAASVCLAALVLLPHQLPGTTRLLVAWDVGAGLYLALAWSVMWRADIKRMRQRARRQDDGALAVLALTVATPVASLAAIVLELVGVRSYPPREQTLHLALAAVTVLFSWFLIHTSFALHYAHGFYGPEDGVGRRCIEFPGTEQPDYVDFLYFAFVIGTASATADVTIASSPMRRLALVHGVVSFFFNATLLALTINIAAGLI
jgi:uncharacterized membrane protein